MRCHLGIDLGSTTTKAVLLNEAGRVVGRGITNSRSDYELAARIAREEALNDARLNLQRRFLEERAEREVADRVLARLAAAYRREMHLHKLGLLREACLEEAQADARHAPFDVCARIGEIFDRIADQADRLDWRRDAESDFFRDLAGAAFIREADRAARGVGEVFDALVGIFDKSILRVENRVVESAFAEIEATALRRLGEVGVPAADLERAVDEAAAVPIEIVGMVGTGYGRQRLPFPKESIRSEILCHGLGAHRLFPRTATILDIGGQDTKAIQLDERGTVTSFQMNDRCAAGCGRYLGYIADEMNLGLHELGPLAMKATRTPRINSTCTVFAGAELRNRLLAGERREDILAGLHRAIALRAMSLLARSGGVRNEFTMTGGVAKNVAAVAALRALIRENYGEGIRINTHPDSIYTGALGAALFAMTAGGSDGTGARA